MFIVLKRFVLPQWSGALALAAARFAAGLTAGALLERGLARRYSGGRRESWCG
jgi:hypothetical protein